MTMRTAFIATRSKKTAVKKTAKTGRKTARKSTAKAAPRVPRKRPAPPPEPLENWQLAVEAAESKKALNLKVLDLRAITAFADTFLICSGANARQCQAIADEIGDRLEKEGRRPNASEGYQNAEWVLLDYGDLVVHIFSEKAREYYDLERLWRTGTTIYPPGAIEAELASEPPAARNA